MADLQISKQTIYELFTGVKSKKFIIPDYQRPYQWDTEKCETLWNDIEQFSDTNPNEDDFYFLGTIVSYDNEDKNQEIIDGQQRLTSFTLLLRAFYKKLQDSKSDAEVEGLKKKLESCIWAVNKYSGNVDDYTDIKVISRVIDDKEKEIFHSILETGCSVDDATDNYSRNYRLFKEKCDRYAMENPLKWKDLYITILNHCIILPIKCESQESALTIFSTLNDRGLPLSDSDIFKAKLYANLKDKNAKDNFIVIWRELFSLCKKSGMSLNDLFRYYTHIIRARSNDASKEIGLRKFYLTDPNKSLYLPNLLEELKQLALFWEHIAISTEKRDDFYIELSPDTRKYLSCLKSYPNEYWKYAVSVFFISNKNKDDFDLLFQRFLLKLISFLFLKFIEYPSVNAIKDDIFNLCAFIVNQTNGRDVSYSFSADEFILSSFDTSKKLTRSLLLLNSYLTEGQNDIVLEPFEIEHIFPKKWQDTNYNGWSNTDADVYLEKLGNKIIFEKKLNIQAGNGYFGRKKQAYSESKIQEVKNLSKYHKNDWVKEDIEKRDFEIKMRLLEFFKANLA